MSVQTVDESLNGGLVQVTDVSGRLTRLLAHHLEQMEWRARGGEESKRGASA